MQVAGAKHLSLRLVSRELGWRGSSQLKPGLRWTAGVVPGGLSCCSTPPDSPLALSSDCT